MQLASTVSLFFSAALKLLLRFSQQLQKPRKIQMFLTQTDHDTEHMTRKIGPLYFNMDMCGLVIVVNASMQTR